MIVELTCNRIGGFHTLTMHMTELGLPSYQLAELRCYLSDHSVESVKLFSKFTHFVHSKQH